MTTPKYITLHRKRFQSKYFNKAGGKTNLNFSLFILVALIEPKTY